MAQLRTLYQGEERDLFRVLLNAVSSAEANLALKLLTDVVPDKILVSTCNLREVLRALPPAPFLIETNIDQLAQAAEVEHFAGGITLSITAELALVLYTAGPIVLDVALVRDGSMCFWGPDPDSDDFIGTEALDLCIDVEGLLDTVINVVARAGVPFSPKFYLSLDDWRLDHAAEAFKSLGDLF